MTIDESLQRHIATFNSDAASDRQRTENDRLRVALRNMVDAFKPFTLKPIGAPGSSARADQDAQIKAHAEAVAALGAKV